jgi:radical SAM superfamily enzyme
VIEATINQQNHEIADCVAGYMPDVLGVSTYIWNAGKLPVLLNMLKKILPKTVFVLGGPEASYNAEYWLKLGADYVIRGEGEHSFSSLIDELADHKLQAQNECFVNDPQFQAARWGESAITEHATEPIDPYTNEFFDALNGRITYIETSRGCPFRCSFCLSADKGVRYFPLEPVKKQINVLSQSDTHTIKFVDRTFNCNAARAYELFEYILKLDTSCTFHFEAAADIFDERTLSLLASAPSGLFQFEIGLQSFHEPALKVSVRQTDLKKAEENIKRLLQAKNIHVHVDLIAGLPHETLENFKSGFNRVYTLGAHTIQLGFLKLLYGSDMREQAGEMGIRFLKEPPYEITGSPWLSSEDILILKQTENALQHTYNKGRFLLTIENMLDISGLSPFDFFHNLGTAAPNHGTQLENYIEQIYAFCVSLSGVDDKELRDHLMCDWLGMVKGKNTPAFLKRKDSRCEAVEREAEKVLGRKPGRGEVAVLSSGKGVFVDSSNRDKVTGLYKVYFL